MFFYMALKMQEQTSVDRLSVNTGFKFYSILNYLITVKGILLSAASSIVNFKLKV